MVKSSTRVCVCSYRVCQNWGYFVLFFCVAPIGSIASFLSSTCAWITALCHCHGQLFVFNIIQSIYCSDSSVARFAKLTLKGVLMLCFPSCQCVRMVFIARVQYKNRGQHSTFKSARYFQILIHLLVQKKSNQPLLYFGLKVIDFTI